MRAVLPQIPLCCRINERGCQHSGLSSFAENPDGVAAYLAPLLEHARSHIPPSLHPDTPLFLYATAGMRLLTPEQQASVLQSTCHFLKFHSNFLIDDPSVAGPCGSSVRIITGEEEGLFGWIAVNYLMDGFGRSDDDRTTFGFLDMGGASTQIAFEPSLEEQEKSDNLIDVRLRLLGGEEIRHSVFVTTWLGYGTNQARERYVAQAIDAYEPTRPASSHGEPSDVELIEDPCLPRDLTLTEQPVHIGSSTSHTRKPHTLVGTGSFGQCLAEVTPLLNKTVPCPDSPCLFNGIHVPPIDFSVSHFIGVSEYWYSSEHIFGLGGPYDFVQYERAAQDFCSKPWSEILQMHEESKKKGHLGGDGEVQENGQVVGLDKWGDRVEIPRLEMQCFKAAWIVNVLHEGLGMPRIVDPGGNSSTHGEDVKKQAEQKGLGRPTFQSMDTVGDIAISWTLGKMVLEASKEVPSLFVDDKPIVDPIDDVSDPDKAPFQPIRPPFIDAIEDHLSPHLPPSLTRESLGFSLVGLLFYLIVILFFLSVAYRLRHHLRLCLRRLSRLSYKRDNDLAYSLEEGHFLNGNGQYGSPYPSRPSSPSSRRWLRSIRKLNPFWRTRPSPINTSASRPPIRHVQTSPAGFSPLRSMPLPSVPSPKGITVQRPNSATPSPTTATFDENGFLRNNGDLFGVSSLSSYSRSRNSSTISLTTLVPRGTLSRNASAMHLSAMGHDD